MDNSQARTMMRKWLDDSEAYIKQASQIKQAADEAAERMADPHSKGVVTIPGFGDGADREAQGLPANRNNLGEADKQHDLFEVTTPNGTGQGSYITPRDGDAIDARATSPTSPLEKISGIVGQLNDTVAGLSAEAPAAAPEATATKEAAQAAATVQMPISIAQDKDLMSKLASIGAFAIGTEEGQRAMRVILEKEAGYKEAQYLIGMIHEEMAKEAAYAAAQEAQPTYTQNYDMEKEAAMQMYKQAATAAHTAWLDHYETEMEKMAYAQGAMDGDAMADSAAAGGPAEIPGGGEEPSMEDVMAYLEQGVQSGTIAPEEAQAVLEAIGAAGDDGVSPEEFADAIRQAVESGQMDPAQAEQLAQEYLAQMGGMEGGAPEEAAAAEDPAAAAAEDPAAAAAAEGVQKAASVINDLWGN